MVYHNVLRMRPVIDYLSEHFTEKTYIEQLAAMITVSPDYFTKMFKESITKSIFKFSLSVHARSSFVQASIIVDI